MAANKRWYVHRLNGLGGLPHRRRLGGGAGRALRHLAWSLALRCASSALILQNEKTLPEMGMDLDMLSLSRYNGAIVRRRALPPRLEAAQPSCHVRYRHRPWLAQIMSCKPKPLTQPTGQLTDAITVLA